MGMGMKTLYGKGDRVRIRSITSEMPAVVVEDEDGRRGARVLSNALANMDAVRDLLDKDKPASEAANTKIARP